MRYLIRLALLAFHGLSVVAFGGPFSDVFSDSAKIEAAKPKPPHYQPISIELDQSVAAVADSGRFKLTAYSGKNCKYCQQAHKLWGNGDNRAAIDWTEKPLPEFIRQKLKQPYNFPVLVWEKAGGVVGWPAKWDLYTLDAIVEMCERDGALRNGGEAMASHRLSAAELKAFANQYHGEIVGVRGMTVRSHLMDANHRFGADQLVGLSEQEMLAVHSGHHNNQIQPSEMVPAAVVASRASAVGGSINARPQIEAAIAFIRQRVGEGVPMRFEWDRTGAQSLPLLKGGAWTPDAIYGKSGEFRISAEGAVGLPLQDVAIGYRFVKGRLRLRGETEIDAGILDWSHAGGDGASTGGGSGAVGIDPMTLLTVFSVLNSIWQALHPTADLTLGGNISCEAILHGDTLAVKFKQAPSVRVVAWFTFVLGVDAVDISTEKVRIGFTGSRWVKERTLEVN